MLQTYSIDLFHHANFKLQTFETGPNCTNQILSQPKSILLLLLARRLSLSLSFYLLTFSVCYLTCPIIPSFFNVFRKPKPRNIFCQRDLVRSSFSYTFISHPTSKHHKYAFYILNKSLIHSENGKIERQRKILLFIIITQISYDYISYILFRFQIIIRRLVCVRYPNTSW